MPHFVTVTAKKPKKMGFISFSSYNNRKGILTELIDNNGHVMKEFTMERPVLTLNLDNDFHVRIYEFIKDHPLTHQGIVKVEDQTEKELKVAEKAINSADAVIIAAKMNTKEYRDFAKLAGFGQTSNDEVLKSKVIKIII